MLSRRMNSPVDNKWVMNLSSENLCTPERPILSKGLNFAPAPKKVPIPQIVAAVENGLRGVDEGTAEGIRHKVIGLLGKARPPPTNITPSERRALTGLRNDTSIVILPADKGRATVVLNTQDYEQKMKDMLSDRSTYQVMQRDPTASLRRGR